MELRQLRYFQAVVKAGSLSAAALTLHVSQPPLSVAISKLEAELGVELLIRTPRGVEPTTAGGYLLDASSRLLDDVDDIVATLGRFRDGLEGALTMAAVPVLTWHRVPQLLRRHARSHPGVEVRLTFPTPWVAIDMLRQRRVDVAAVMVSNHQAFAARHRGVLDIMDWGPVPLVAVLPPEFSSAPDPLPVSEFQDSTLVMPPRMAAAPSLPETVDTYLQECGVVPATYRYVETIQGGLPLVESGLAKAILPDPDRKSLSRFNVVVRELDPVPEPLRALVLTRHGVEVDPALQSLLQQMSKLRSG